MFGIRGRPPASASTAQKTAMVLLFLGPQGVGKAAEDEEKKPALNVETQNTWLTVEGSQKGGGVRTLFKHEYPHD